MGDLQPPRTCAVARDLHLLASEGLCCVDWKRGSGNGGAVSQVSEAGGEFSESDADTMMGRYVNGEFVVAAAQVLYERVPARDVRR
jgi:hypothetical protein